MLHRRDAKTQRKTQRGPRKQNQIPEPNMPAREGTPPDRMTSSDRPVGQRIALSVVFSAFSSASQRLCGEGFSQGSVTQPFALRSFRSTCSFTIFFIRAAGIGLSNAKPIVPFETEYFFNSSASTSIGHGVGYN